MKTSRPYRMTARLDAVAATRRRILEAVRDIAYERLEFEPTLDAVATRADVSVQTVLRHFTTREALLSAAREWARDEIVAERRPPGRDVTEALSTLLEHYELRGDFVLAMLARETANETVAEATTAGRREHRVWVEQVFEERLPRDLEERAALVDLLVVATDVYAWKLLRRDRQLSVETVRDRMRRMTDALLADSPRRTQPNPEKGTKS